MARFLCILFSCFCVLVAGAQNLESVFTVYLDSEDGREPSCVQVEHPINLQGITVHSDYVPTRVTIINGNDTLYSSAKSDAPFGAKFKVRGNTSAVVDKKPYKIKLEKKADLLFRSPKRKDKEWVLLAGDVQGQMNAIVGMQFNREAGMDFSPMWSFCRLYVNGNDKGMYLLTETVKRNEDARVNVDSTGFIAEYDAYWWDEDFAVGLKDVIKFTFKYPKAEDMTDGQKEYFSGYLNSFLQSTSAKNYDEYIDVDSFALWLLMQDVLGNSDSMGANLFFSKSDNTASSKMRMGPLWDFDCLGRSKGWSRQHLSNTLFFKQLLSAPNFAFLKAYKKLWNDNKKMYETEMKGFLSLFEQSPVAASLAAFYGENDYNKALKFLNDWFDTRFQWIDDNINTVIYQRAEFRDCFFYDVLGRKYSKGTPKTLLVNKNRKLYVTPK